MRSYGSDIKTAFRNSGLFLEASLAAGLKTGQPAASANTLPDMKAALLVLREALSISVGDMSRGAPPAVGAGSQQAQQAASPMASGAPPCRRISTHRMCICRRRAWL